MIEEIWYVSIQVFREEYVLENLETFHRIVLEMSGNIILLNVYEPCLGKKCFYDDIEM